MNVANKRTLRFTTTSSKTDSVDTQQRQDTRQIMTDRRMITAEQLRGKVSENNNLSPQQQEDLYNVLIKYQQHLTKRPGKCTKFEYEFKIEGSMPTSANSRPIPFALRYQVPDQIQIMLKDDILEESFLSYINPLTLVVREVKPLRICVDARRINRQMTADRTKVLPLREFRNFTDQVILPAWTYAAHFSEFHLKKLLDNRQRSSFKVKFTNLRLFLMGLRTVSAVIGALEKVSRDDKINNNLVMYLDDLLHLLALSERLQLDARV